MSRHCWTKQSLGNTCQVWYPSLKYLGHTVSVSVTSHLTVILNVSFFTLQYNKCSAQFGCSSLWVESFSARWNTLVVPGALWSLSLQNKRGEIDWLGLRNEPATPTSSLFFHTLCFSLFLKFLLQTVTSHQILYVLCKNIFLNALLWRGFKLSEGFLIICFYIDLQPGCSQECSLTHLRQCTLPYCFIFAETQGLWISECKSVVQLFTSPVVVDQGSEILISSFTSPAVWQECRVFYQGLPCCQSLSSSRESCSF